MEALSQPIAMEARDGSGVMLLLSPGLVAWRDASGAWSTDLSAIIPDGSTIEELANDFAPIVLTRLRFQPL